MCEKTTLKEISELITKGTTPTSIGGVFTDSGIYFIKSESICGSKFLNRDVFGYIDEETDRKLKRSRLAKDDLLFSIAGAYLGKIGIVRDEDLPSNTNQAVGIVRLNKNVVDVNYVFYYFSQNHINQYINQLSSQSSQPNLNLDLLGKLEIELKDINTQQKIAAVLSSLDSKIELNNKINAELEAMAKTLYDYWFVQFDFPDKDGKPYKTSGGKMVWNDELKREVPDGWEVGTLLNIADYINGLPCQKFRPTGDEFLRVIKIREMNEGFSVNSEFVSPDIPEKAIIENGDVLFSWSASLDVKIWTGGKGALNQHIFKVTSDKYPKSFYFYQLLNYLQHFKMMAENRKTTMGHITQEHLQQSRIAIPTEKLTLELEKIIAPIFKQKMVNEIQNQTLSTLRDWLLPMLMNGQVTIHTD